MIDPLSETSERPASRDHRYADISSPDTPAAPDSLRDVGITTDSA
jgi:hypothetical protein